MTKYAALALPAKRARTHARGKTKYAALALPAKRARTHALGMTKR
ncbi:MAG TPA: hypothetical protein VMD07_04970 [Candidatus Acidoferrales bacterium]|nr:hypothetical protein [Candidatus Acidoferrales bacterium]